MTVFLGGNGAVRLRRGLRSPLISITDEISPNDINTSLNRLSFDSSVDNLLTGDRVEITTTDARGLICFSPSSWSSGAVESSISAYVNVNAVGGLRFFSSFEPAVNNDRSQEYTLASFSDPALAIAFSVKDAKDNSVGDITSYTLNTEREAIDVTALSDKFKRQYSAGIISGSGTIDCVFNYTNVGDRENSLLLIQLIQRVDIGSEVELFLYLTDKDLDINLTTVFYRMEAMITRSGVTVGTDDVIRCTVDFVTVGEIQLLVGAPASYILTEDDDRVIIEQSLDYLLQETDD
jgi:hypothetical protein